MPAEGAEEDEKEKEKEEGEEGAGDGDDDKLYCVCKTSYDEERVMIACDRSVFLLIDPFGFGFLLADHGDMLGVAG